MSGLAEILRRVVTSAFDVALAPFMHGPALIGLAAVSLVSAILTLAVFRLTSNPTRTQRSKDTMYAALLEMRLYNDDPVAVIAATGTLGNGVLRYWLASLIPVLWLVIPFALAVPQVESYFAYRGIAPGTPALVTAELAPGASSTSATAITLDLASGLDMATGLGGRAEGVWFPASRSLAWLVTPRTAGTFLIRLRNGAMESLTTIQAGDDVGRRSVERLPAAPSVLWRAPSEPGLTDPAIARLTVNYPGRDYPVLGWKVNWLILWIGLTFCAAIALRRVFGVTW